MDPFWPALAVSQFKELVYNQETSRSRGVAQPGSAPALGAGGRVFESHRPDQLYAITYRRILTQKAGAVSK